MNKLYEALKVDIGLPPTSLASTNATGCYFSLAEYRKALAVLNAAAMAATKTCKLEIYEAEDAAGTGAQLLTSASVTITANTDVTSLTLALASVLAADTVTINGITFTAHGTTTTLANREFSISGNDTADGTELAACINDATYGVPGVTATNNAGTLTLVSTVPGATTITASTSGATVTIATVRAQAYIEVDSLSLSDGFTHIACKVTTDATIVAGAVLLRGASRKGIDQAVADSADV